MAANYKLLRGEAPVWALEPNSGGYYYQYSQIGYKKASMVVDLKNSKLHIADSGYENFVAYAFISVHNGTHFYDLGIVFINDGGYWALKSNKYDYDPATIKYSTDGSVCTAHKTGTEWSGDAKVEITVEAVEDGFKATIKNLGTGRSYTITVGNTPLNLSSNDFVFQFSASLVPPPSDEDTPNYRCGAYFKNIQLTECKVYTKSGVASPCFATSPTTSMALVYNTDCCSATATSSKTTVDIFYNRPYTE